VLKRHLSTVPSAELPAWCRSPESLDFLPILLMGAWDDANEADRSLLSRLSNRPYSEILKIAARLTLADDPPLTRNETRWRLVSPEDSWWLAGKQITPELLQVFKNIAIEALHPKKRRLSRSSNKHNEDTTGERRELRASVLLRRGIAETAAILGSGFEQSRSCAVRKNTRLQSSAQYFRAAPARVGALGDVLPLLAEAAPEEFLDAISARLEEERPELAALLADGGDNAFISRCKHAGLLWGLEAVAWSPDLFGRTCAILAGLDAVDTGGTWGNRPAASLVEILLPWHPQTAAGVDKRVAVLKSLADRAPATAWKILFAMMPATAFERWSDASAHLARVGVRVEGRNFRR